MDKAARHSENINGEFEMIKINSTSAMRLHRLITDKTGGDASIRDTALLESALASAFATFDGIELYPTLEEKGARLGFSLIANHAFVDGNKRIGMLVMLTFLEINGIKLCPTDDEVVRVGLSVASGGMRYDALLDWILANRC